MRSKSAHFVSTGPVTSWRSRHTRCSKPSGNWRRATSLTKRECRWNIGGMFRGLQPAKLRQKDRDARWTVKFSKAKPVEDSKPKQVDIAVPAFGYKNHASIDRHHGFIRGWAVTSAAAWDGAQLRNVVARNTGSMVWATPPIDQARTRRGCRSTAASLTFTRRSRKAGL